MKPSRWSPCIRRASGLHRLPRKPSACVIYTGQPPVGGKRNPLSSFFSFFGRLAVERTAEKQTRLGLRETLVTLKQRHKTVTVGTVTDQGRPLDLKGRGDDLTTSPPVRGPREPTDVGSSVASDFITSFAVCTSAVLIHLDGLARRLPSSSPGARSTQCAERHPRVRSSECPSETPRHAMARKGLALSSRVPSAIALRDLPTMTWTRGRRSILRPPSSVGQVVPHDPPTQTGNPFGCGRTDPRG